MSSRTLWWDVASLHCGWADVGQDLVVWLKSSPTIWFDFSKECDFMCLWRALQLKLHVRIVCTCLQVAHIIWLLEHLELGVKGVFLSSFSLKSTTRMFGHVSFESIGPATWVTALCALVWFFSSVNAEVGFQIYCFGEWAPALFAVMWLLSTVGEQVLRKIFFCDRRWWLRFLSWLQAKAPLHLNFISASTFNPYESFSSTVV